METKTIKLTREELKERLARPKSPLIFAETLLDTALRVSIEKYQNGETPKLEAKVEVFNCGHMVPPVSPGEGEPLGGCTAVSITIEGVTTTYCKCVGISSQAY